MYISNDNKLYGEVVKACHDFPTTGHPEKHGTLELVQRYYWWPHIASFVEKYILGCDVCQHYKSAQHLKALLQLQDISDYLWKFMGVNLITQLPVSCNHSSIGTYIDHLTDQTHLTLTNDMVSAEGVTDLHYKDIFRLHGIP